ncbi:2-oxoglutarate (2OG) and Fe(II)-dependent oxygenase superfamily protein [Rhynchospora pubera]|uniref:procollagen-proline 4-dioxygenase n=1 Tax=Rhynchospora pubera TaxID=906938 RepID=A0AAV8AG54_9POAL|nr:2-oxoglutarate (2OG) and Fe(II)-dependent oxygenase superfamily protein [Rhynchospora pubera]KAJ4809314.1 2-oxoglutarate (2OG) and Fe(II)-dependent oxygenase superfamily protein [Rhynchospora pubera]
MGRRCMLFAFVSLMCLFFFIPVLKSEETKINGVGFDPTNVVQISWKPRIFLYKGFLSDEECDHLVTLAKKKLAKSTVADNESGESIMSEVRTSSGMFLSKRQDEIVTIIEERIAAWTFLPEENAESIQILRYQHGQKYEPHFDYFHDKKNQVRGGHRLATVLMYLSDVKFGGETVFPQAEFEHLQVKDETWSDCAKNGLAVKAVKGDAVLFFSLHPDGTPDPNSLHGSCPVIEGEKWSAPKWIHVGSFDKLYVSTDGCSDETANCGPWAAAGECEKNPAYMLASCKRSCGVCGSNADA